MIDLHVHLLPGIDDGAEDLSEAVGICRLAGADGCRALVATPHQRHALWGNRDRGRLERLLSQVQEMAGEEISLHLGAEIRIDSELLREVDLLPGGDLLTLAGSRYLLLEPERSRFGPDLAEIVHEVMIAGYVPIVAHPEFIRGLGDDLDLAHRLAEAGALFQLTAMSVSGKFGRRPQRISAAFLDAGLAHFIASDAHGAVRRPPGLARARDLIARRWGEETAWRLTDGNPAAVLEDRPLAPPEAIAELAAPAEPATEASCGSAS